VRRLARRPHLLAAVVLGVVALAFVSPALLPGKVLSNSDSYFFKAPWSAGRPADLVKPANPEFDDAPAQTQPFARYTVRHGLDLPLWNPHVMTGRPFLANMQSAIFSPFQVLTYVLGFWPALAWIAVLKLWVAAFGAYLLARAAGMGLAGGLVAGLVYGFNLWLVCWLSYPHASVWALVPWLALLAGRMAREPTRRGAVALAGLVGAQFVCGHPESSFHAMLAATAVFGWGLLARRRSGAPLGPALATYAGAVVAGVALAALVLLPFAELLVGSADIRQRAGAAKEFFVPRKYLLGAFLPFHWGKPTQTPIDFFLLARAIYVGALPLMLVAAGLLLRPTRARIATAGAATICLLVVFGIPPVFNVVVAIPPFSSGHNTRLIALALLCGAMLAGWGLDDLLARRGSPARRRAVLGTGAALFGLPVLLVVVGGRTTWGSLPEALRVAWGFADPPGPEVAGAREVVRGAGLLVWIGVGGAALALLVVLSRGTRRPALVVGLALALIAGDLARAGIGYNPAIDRADAEQPVTPAIALLERANPERFVATGDIPQNAISMDHGLFEARGYDLPVERRFDRLWRTRLSPQFSSQVGAYPANIPLSLPKVDVASLRGLRLLGVRHVLQPPTDPLLRVPGLTLVHPGPDARVYRLAETNPRATVVDAQLPVAGEEAALSAVTAAGFDPRRAVVTERRLPGLRLASAGSPPAPAGEAAIRRTEADAVDVGVRARRAGLLVLSDAYARGWRAEVDGRPAEVERVNYVMRGVRVPAGTHRVTFAYAPASWRIGWITSLVALLGLVAVGLWPRRARAGRPAAARGA